MQGTFVHKRPLTVFLVIHSYHKMKNKTIPVRRLSTSKS